MSDTYQFVSTLYHIVGWYVGMIWYVLYQQLVGTPVRIDKMNYGLKNILV